MENFRQNGKKRFGQDREGGFGNRDGNRPAFGQKSWGQDRDRPVTMHKATCAQCGSPCEVPFRPVEGRPIYCRDCFHGQKNTSESRNSDRPGQRDFNNNKSFAKPDFGNNSGGGNNGELKSQLETLNAKIDRLIQAVETLANPKPAAEVKTSETAQPVVPAKVKKSAKKVKKTKK